MGQALAVAVGAALGGLCRWGLSHFFVPMSSSFPWGIFVVNLLGSLCIGLCFGLFRGARPDDAWALFWMVGVLGGFTTFSAFSLDLMKMAAGGRWGAAFAYASLSCMGGLAMAGLGGWLSGGFKQI